VVRLALVVPEGQEHCLALVVLRLWEELFMLAVL
jgi:hypothetical protein